LRAFLKRFIRQAAVQKNRHIRAHASSPALFEAQRTRIL
jgi:hypothetical protein